MNRRTIRTVIVLAVFSFLGIILVQLYWLNKAYSIEQKKFSDQVQIALNSVADEIYSLKDEHAQIPEPVTRISSNHFLVKINDTLHPYLLESMLIPAFRSRNLGEKFEYAIYDCFTDSIVYGKSVDINDEHLEPPKYMQQLKWEKDGHYFGVYFPKKNATVLSNLDIWIYTSLLLVIITIFFAYTLFIVLKQKKLSEIRNDFINNMTHELKTPIATISLTSGALKKNLHAPDKLEQYVDILGDESKRLKNLVEKVLQASNAENHNIRLKKEEIDVCETLQKCVAKLSQQYSPKSAITVNCPKNARLTSDHFHFENMLVNLVENALKYGGESVQVNLEVKTTSQWVEIVVSDNGPGISEAHSKKVFEKFYRVPQGNLYQSKSYGLGLFYVKEVVERMHGSIHLKSKQNQGCVFTLKIPINHE